MQLPLKSAMTLTLTTLGLLISSQHEAKAIAVTLQVDGGSFASSASNVTVFSGTTSSGITIAPDDGSGNDARLTFTSNNPTPRTYLEPAAVDLGSFALGLPGGGNTYSLVPGSTTFSVTITQLNPAADGPQTLDTALSGSVTRQMGALGGQFILTFQFDQTSFVLGGVRYDLIDLGPGNTLTVNPGTLGQPSRTDLRAQITAVNAVPEPATMALAFSGLGSLGLYGLRRSRRTQPSIAA
jgi:hypothetical protein